VGAHAAGESSMTVGELIEALKAFPADRRVVVPGYEGGADDILAPKQICIRSRDPDHTEDWFGPHAVRDVGEPAVLIADVRQHKRVRL
jgi:hypothetical protein